ncbi:hypothetical protein CUMW_077040 [Citrus unshiu]|nr:hypothetical protein CUMW_077040 [Citrus unshiu]
MKAKAEKVEKINIIKPQPRTFAKNSQWLKGKGMTSNNLQLGDYNLGKQSTPSDDDDHHHQQQQENETESVWWESFLFGDELDQQGISSLLSRPEEESTTANIFAEKSPVVTKVKENRVIEAGQSCTTDDFAFDAELWDLLNPN